MEITLTIDDYIDLIKEATRAELEHHEGRYFFIYDLYREQWKVEIDLLELQESINRLQHISEAQETDIYSTRYYEVLVRREQRIVELAPIQWRKSEETGTLNRGVKDNGNRAQKLHRRIQTRSRAADGKQRQTCGTACA